MKSYFENNDLPAVLATWLVPRIDRKREKREERSSLRRGQWSRSQQRHGPELGVVMVGTKQDSRYLVRKKDSVPKGW